MTLTAKPSTSTDKDTETSPAAPKHPLSVSLGRFSALFLWVAFIIIFGILKPHVFLTASTFRLTFAEGVVTAVLALAFLIPLAAGAYDLSVGAMMGLSLVVLNWFGVNHPSVPIGVVAVRQRDDEAACDRLGGERRHVQSTALATDVMKGCGWVVRPPGPAQRHPSNPPLLREHEGEPVQPMRHVLEDSRRHGSGP